MIDIWQHLHDNPDQSDQSDANETEHDQSESEDDIKCLLDFKNKVINPEKFDTAIGELTIKTLSMSCFFHYAKDTTVQDLKDTLTKKFGIEDDTYRLYVDGSYLEPYDVIDTYLKGTSKIVELKCRLKGGGKNKVIKTTLKCKSNTKTTNDDRALFEKSFATALKIGGLSADDIDIKKELKLMSVASLEEMKAYIVKDKTKKSLKIEKLASFLDAYKEMSEVQEKMTSALNAMKDMFVESAEAMCSNSEGEIDFTDLLEFINKTIGAKERDEADAML
eukprot:Skav200673  [mRNA]  locus=scaffold1967:161051:161881:+ [translate_table: standard]